MAAVWVAVAVPFPLFQAAVVVEVAVAVADPFLSFCAKPAPFFPLPVAVAVAVPFPFSCQPSPPNFSSSVAVAVSVALILHRFRSFRQTLPSSFDASYYWDAQTPAGALV